MEFPWPGPEMSDIFDQVVIQVMGPNGPNFFHGETTGISMDEADEAFVVSKFRPCFVKDAHTQPQHEGTWKIVTLKKT